MSTYNLDQVERITDQAASRLWRAGYDICYATDGFSDIFLAKNDGHTSWAFLTRVLARKAWNEAGRRPTIVRYYKLRKVSNV